MRGYSCIGLDNPQNPINVGSVMRAAGCYEARAVMYSGRKYKGSKFITDTQKNYRHIPLFCVDDLRQVIPYDCVPVAVDLIKDAIPLPEYQHPKRAFYIFGAENATLGKRITGWCRDVIFIPTTYCMNLAAAVNVVLYDRLSKEIE